VKMTAINGMVSAQDWRWELRRGQEARSLWKRGMWKDSTAGVVDSQEHIG
jgi:hypothetical protein